MEKKQQVDEEERRRSVQQYCLPRMSQRACSTPDRALVKIGPFLNENQPMGLGAASRASLADRNCLDRLFANAFRCRGDPVLNVCWILVGSGWSYLTNEISGNFLERSECSRPWPNRIEPDFDGRLDGLCTSFHDRLAPSDRSIVACYLNRFVWLVSSLEVKRRYLEEKPSWLDMKQFHLLDFHRDSICPRLRREDRRCRPKQLFVIS